MSIFKRKERLAEKATVKLITDNGQNFQGWTGSTYDSDIVRSCIRPFALQASKLAVKHLRETYKDGVRDIEVFPEPYMRVLLEEPNDLMSMSKLMEKLAINLKLNNNAFALIYRDPNGVPLQIIPIDATEASEMHDDAGNVYVRFYMPQGEVYTFPYKDLIHLRRDFYGRELFGHGNSSALLPLMDIISTSDQGIIAAIKNSAVIKWLLKFLTTTRPEDLEKEAERFAKSYMNVENGNGVAAVDARVDAQQVIPHNYVPTAGQTGGITERVLSFFGVSHAIVQNSADEEQMNAYFEADVEPFVVDCMQEFTRKLFTRRERAVGNRIVFDAGMLQAASIRTKLALVALVDRGALTPNEWRAFLNLSPVEGGDVPIRRLDTEVVTESDLSSE